MNDLRQVEKEMREEVDKGVGYGTCGRLREWADRIADALRGSEPVAFSAIVTSYCDGSRFVELRSPNDWPDWIDKDLTVFVSPSSPQPQVAVEVTDASLAAYDAGFMASSEGWNGEYGGDTDSRYYLQKRAEYFDALTQQPSNDWNCPNCGVTNPTFDPWCSACETPQPSREEGEM